MGTSSLLMIAVLGNLVCATCIDFFLEDKLQPSSWSPWRKFALDCYLLVQSFSWQRWHHRTPPTRKNVIHPKISNKRSSMHQCSTIWLINWTNWHDQQQFRSFTYFGIRNICRSIDRFSWSCKVNFLVTTSCFINSFIWFFQEKFSKLHDQLLQDKSTFLTDEIISCEIQQWFHMDQHVTLTSKFENMSSAFTNIIIISLQIKIINHDLWNQFLKSNGHDI